MFSFLKKKPKPKQQYNIGKLAAEFIFSTGERHHCIFIGEVRQQIVGELCSVYNYVKDARDVFEEYLAHHQTIGYYKMFSDSQEKYLPVSSCVEIKTINADHFVEE